MSNELTIKGKTQVCGIEVPNVIGGFGEIQKVMMAKTVADMFGMEVGRVNEVVSRHKDKFVPKVDIIDVKGTDFAIAICESGIMTQNAINAAKNIYVFSQKGLMNLCTQLNSPLAWEKYIQMRDEYFEMKENLKFSTPKQPRLHEVFREESSIAKELAKLTGVRKEIAVAIAIDRTERRTGESLDEYKRLLPAAQHETGVYNATDVGVRVELNAFKVNKLLEDLTLQYREDYQRRSKKSGEMKTESQWRLTDKGKEFGEEFPFNRNGHSGYQIKWNEKVITKIKDHLAASRQELQGDH